MPPPPPRSPPPPLDADEIDMGGVSGSAGGPAGGPVVSANYLGRLPPGTMQDWYDITHNVAKITIKNPVTPIIMLGRAFPIVTTVSLDTVIAATRYSKGTALSLGSESMVLSCCGSSKSDATIPGLDQLLLNGAVWAAWYGIKCGEVKVRLRAAG
ncbi:hypothetical protein TSOC_014351, partial [Tetrabaena socialis]